MSQETVFIIGSGASAEVNLPTSDLLKSNIAELLNIRLDPESKFTPRLISGDSIIFRSFGDSIAAPQVHVTDTTIQDLLYEAWHIRDTIPLAPSIDQLIDQHRNNRIIAFCGKLAIVRSILKAERQSYLYFEQTRDTRFLNYEKLQGTWYIPFFHWLTENCSTSDLEGKLKSINLIIFNYDRCIEHFIFHSLRHHYKLNESETAELLCNMNIYHPYGDVGSLPWQQQDFAVEFGAEISSDQLLQLSKRIRTFTEGTNPSSSEIVEIRTAIASSTLAVFLGFAFLDLNMNLLKPDPSFKARTSNVECFATTLGISDSDGRIVAERIQDLYRDSVYFHPARLSCAEFFKEFRINLSYPDYA